MPKPIHLFSNHDPMKRFATTCVLAVMTLVLHAMPASASTAEEYFDDALSMHNSGNIQEAIRLYSKAIDSDQRFVMAYQMRGAAWQKLYQFRKAIADYTMVIDLGDLWFQAVGYFNRGVVRTLAGRYDEAIPDFTQAIAIDRKMSAAFLHRGIARVKTGDRNGTFEDFREAARLGDPDAEHLLNSATAASSSGKNQ